MSIVAGVAEQIPGYRDARGYQLGYDTQQTPFEVAKERGLGGVIGGTIDNITRGYTDFDKRGDSQKQKDTKKFLNQFIYGSQGVDARNVRDALGGGDITSFNTGTEPGAKFGYTFDASEKAKQKAFDSEMARQIREKGFNPAGRI